MFAAIVASVGVICVGFILKVMFDDHGTYKPTSEGLLKFIVDSAKEVVKDGVDKKVQELKELEKESEEKKE